MSVASQNCIPSVIEGGSTVRFTVANSLYSSALWTLQFALNNGSDAPLVVDAVPLTGTTGFTVTLTADQTALLAAGQYTWGEMFTNIADSEKANGKSGQVNVLTSLATATAPTQAQQMVALLSGALEALSKTDKLSINFNGQSFTRTSISDYQKQLTYWQARVLRENIVTRALRGDRRGGEIGVSFIQPRATLGLYPTSWRN